MIDSLAGYQSPSLITDAATRESLNAFIAKVLEGLSTLAQMSPSTSPTPTSRSPALAWTSTSWGPRPFKMA